MPVIFKHTADKICNTDEGLGEVVCQNSIICRAIESIQTRKSNLIFFHIDHASIYSLPLHTNECYNDDTGCIYMNTIMNMYYIRSYLYEFPSMAYIAYMY